VYEQSNPIVREAQKLKKTILHQLYMSGSQGKAKREGEIWEQQVLENGSPSELFTYALTNKEFRARLSDEQLNKIEDFFYKHISTPTEGKVTEDQSKSRSIPQELQNPAPAQTPKELAKRIEQLNKFGMANAIARRGGRLGAGTLGKMKHKGKTGEVIIHNDVLDDASQYMSVAAHELAHALEYNLFGKTGAARWRFFGENLDDATVEQITKELQAVTLDLVGAAAVASDTTYYNSRAELLARFFQHMWMKPGTTPELAPKALELLGQRQEEIPLIGEFVEGSICQRSTGAVDEGAGE
jgi:hypothetical protein